MPVAFQEKSRPVNYWLRRLMPLSGWSHPVRLLIGILALGAILRLLFLGEKSFWADEVISVYFARQDWPDFVTILSYETNMMSYHILLRFWLKLGENEFMIRSLSAILAVATVPVLYALGARLFGAKVGLISALLLAVNAFHIRYAQEARSYSLLVLLTALCSWSFLRSIDQPSPKNWAGYVLTSVLAVYSHFFAALVLAAHWASLAFLRPRDVPWKGLVVSTLVTGLLLLPVGSFVLTKDIGQVDWIAQPGPRTVAHAFSGLAGADRFPGSPGGGEFFTLAGAGRTLLLLAYFISCSIAFVPAARVWSSSKASFQTWHYGFLLTWGIVPVMLALGISILKPIFAVRYFAVCLPALVLLAAIGISRVRPTWVFAGALAIIVGLATHTVLSYYKYDKEDWRGATRYILSQVESGDAVVLSAPFVWMAFDYYRAKSKGSTGNVPIVVLSDPEDLLLKTRHQAILILSYSENLPLHYNRVWLVLSHHLDYRVDGPIQASLARKYPTTRERQFTSVKVVLYSRTLDPERRK